MLFKPEQRELIGSQWEEVVAARKSCGNAWQDDWQSGYADLEAAFVRADDSDTPEAWSNLSLVGRQFREVMSRTDGDETFLYIKLVKLTDSIETALDEAATPDNLVARGELRELQRRLDRQIELTQEERQQTSIFERELRRRLDQIEEQLKSGKRTIVKIDEFSVVSLNVNELIAAIKDAIIAIKNGVELLGDPRFTEPLRRGAQNLWKATKRFVRVTRERFAAFKLPWQKDAADEAFDSANPTFGLPPEDDDPPPPSVAFLVRHGTEDRQERRVPGAGQTFQDSWEEGGRRFAGPEMVVVPAGEFLMGSPTDEPQRESWKKGTETPQHKVTITQPFAIGRHAVTRGQFAAFVNDTGYKIEKGAYVLKSSGILFWKKEAGDFDPSKWWRDPGFAQDDQHPVVCVNWEDAQAYVKWLAEKTAKGYRLPSEAEWEYACRAGTMTPFWWGKSITPSQANYDGNYVYEGGGNKGEYRKKTLPVKSFPPNPWGLYQVHGNVWEWCEDTWHDNYTGAPADGSVWATGDSGLRVVRGGSWYDYPRYLRAAIRVRNTPVVRYDIVGFRLSRTLIL